MPDVAEMLDEKSLRRPDFVGGAEVVLLDGRAWTFPAFRLLFSPAPPPDRFRQKSSLGEEHAGLLRAFRSAADNDSVIASSLGLAAWSLLRNYDLTYDQLGELVQFDFGNDPSERDQSLMADVMAASLGKVPRASASS